MDTRLLPFDNVPPIKDWRYYLYWTASIVVFPILFPLKVISLCGAATTAALFAKPFQTRDPNKLLHPVMQFILEHIEAVITRWFTLSLGYFHYKVVNKHLAPQKGDRIVVSNHVSSLDPVFLISLGIPSFLAKAEVGKMPCFGTAANGLRCIFIQRGNGASKIAAKQLKDRITLPNAPITCVFAEGTTANYRALMPFKLGAFEPGVPVRMLTIRYQNRFLDPSDAGKSMAKAALLSMFGLYNSFCVEYLGIYTPTAKEAADPELYANNVRNVFSKHMKITKANYTVFDKFYFRGVSVDYFTWQKTSEEFKKLFGGDPVKGRYRV